MRIAFIGFGEAGSTFVTGWREAGGPAAEIAAYDIKTDRAETAVAQRALYERLGVEGAASLAEALAGADLVISVVTADQALAAARAAAPHLGPGTLYCDMNSVSPGTKRAAARAVDAAGGAYVDVAVMAPVGPKRHLTPLLVSGPHATRAIERLRALPMAAEPAGEEVGRASAIKMLRSVMVKGIEALSAELGLAAAAAGVGDEVLASLNASHGKIDWHRQVAYNLERMVTHGARRAAEMEEVATTLAELGIPNRMARASAEWQRQIAGVGAALRQDRNLADEALATRLLEEMRAKN
ncbi:3-hydroxyisobutyrate dehydrogenase [Meinhardsimonia xiamenensis]|jgi:3-hydroxyisobutyrate dehydrogenase-like beta-hydroxyacid dehydrogenase|uniref:3-hydroxyisobutyrate dehydrogenase n=1 Tax=Meinhardsimonia xiamenensis TaxID=990712 RepID=A0A1G9AXY6_9RHOB|nr:NAD(P)-dependent oxidoreductase [Meinhardsimonia xiamenensis]PRX35203.1 3-hydroxyisobutyrate dehydrogenase-like beta-hydroxyacid dehydrogenase [Meinhardsimonia xiamenensis]SDK32191.1 3-hydroxyisobutyrate dehydrogenase [Meinhardsimonia xiamenensis]